MSCFADESVIRCKLFSSQEERKYLNVAGATGDGDFIVGAMGDGKFTVGATGVGAFTVGAKGDGEFTVGVTGVGVFTVGATGVGDSVVISVFSKVMQDSEIGLCGILLFLSELAQIIE